MFSNRGTACMNFLHFLQAKGFSPAWESMWYFSLLGRLQEKLHWLQAKGFSPECCSMCFLISLAWTHELLHWSQLKCLSPECVDMCSLKWPLCVKEEVQWVHLKGFYPEKMKFGFDSIPVALWITDIHVLWKWCLLTGYISAKRLKRRLEKRRRLGAF